MVRFGCPAGGDTEKIKTSPSQKLRGGGWSESVINMHRKADQRESWQLVFQGPAAPDAQLYLFTITILCIIRTHFPVGLKSHETGSHHWCQESEIG